MRLVKALNITFLLQIHFFTLFHPFLDLLSLQLHCYLDALLLH